MDAFPYNISLPYRHIPELVCSDPSQGLQQSCNNTAIFLWKIKFNITYLILIDIHNGAFTTTKTGQNLEILMHM